MLRGVDNPSTVPSSDLADQLLLWRFFFDVVGIEWGEFDGDHNSIQREFDQLIVVPRGIGIQKLLDLMGTKCPVYTPLCATDFNRIVDQRRNTFKGYKILVRGRVDADREYLNLSAAEITRREIQCITLLECLLFEAMYFAEREKRLDAHFNTLCAGSRFPDGSVPTVGRNERTGGIEIYKYPPNRPSNNLSIREVVT